MKKKSVLALGLVLTMSVSMVGCGSSKKTETEKVNVEVQTPQSGEVTLDTDYIGTVSPEQQVYVVPLVSGTVTQVNYTVGDTVKEGDVLFRIDDEAAQLQMDNARAAYSQAQAGVNAATGTITPSSFKSSGSSVFASITSGRRTPFSMTRT